MDTWHKFRNKDTRKKLTEVDVAKEICYGNFLMSEIAWLASQNKLRQWHIDKFFNQATLILQATIAQKGFNKETEGIYEYIDQITKELIANSVSVSELGLMLGNLTELEDNHYTFTELIAFVRTLGAKI